MLLVRKETTLQVVTHPSGTIGGQSLLLVALSDTLVGISPLERGGRLT
jgi:hypothetical protein